jgi:hypothetical protein
VAGRPDERSISLERNGAILSDHNPEDMLVVGDQWRSYPLLFPCAAQAPLERIHDVFQAIVHVMKRELGFGEAQLNRQL